MKNNALGIVIAISFHFAWWVLSFCCCCCSQILKWVFLWLSNFFSVAFPFGGCGTCRIRKFWPCGGLFLSAHVRHRIHVFLNPGIDRFGEQFQIFKSLDALSLLMLFCFWGQGPGRSGPGPGQGFFAWCSGRFYLCSCRRRRMVGVFFFTCALFFWS